MEERMKYLRDKGEFVRKCIRLMMVFLFEKEKDSAPSTINVNKERTQPLAAKSGF